MNAEPSILINHRSALSVWVALDDVGSQLLARSQKMREELPEPLRQANQILAVSGLDAQNLDEIAESVVQSIGQLLDYAAALDDDIGREDQHIPQLWAVIDSLSPAFEHLSDWLLRLHDLLAHRQVRSRVMLVVRFLSWNHTEEQWTALAGNLKKIIEETCLPGMPGAGATLIFMISDRNTNGARYSPDTVDRTIQRFIDTVMLQGLPPDELSRAFTAIAGADDEEWNLQPVFGSVATRALEWDEPGRLMRRNAEARRHQLAVALDEALPATFKPEPPRTPTLTYETVIEWPRLRPPTWSPRFLQSSRDAYLTASRSFDNWMAEAKRWHHDMCREYVDGRQQIDQHEAAAQVRYVEELDGRTSALLEDPHQNGFFQPMDRLLQRSHAELTTAQRELPADTDGTMPEEAAFDPVTETPGPDDAMGDALGKLTKRLERKINSNLFVTVSVLLFSMLFGWTVYAGMEIRSWQPSGMRRQGTFDLPLKNWISDRVTSAIPGLLDVVPPTPVLVGGAAVMWGLVIAGIGTTIVWRQRISLEQAWRPVNKRARQWQDGVHTTIVGYLTAHEQRANRNLITGCFEEIRERRERLEQLRKRSTEPIYEEPARDPAITDVYPRTLPDARPLTDRLVEETLGRFRLDRRSDPALAERPDRTVQRLAEIAAEVANDPRPDLPQRIRDEASFRSALLATIPGPQTIHMTPRDPNVTAFEIGQVRQFVAGPAAGLETLQEYESVPASIQTIPVETRFYGMALHSEVHARRILGEHALKEFDAVDKVSPSEDTPETPSSNETALIVIADTGAEGEPEESTEAADLEFSLASSQPARE